MSTQSILSMWTSSVCSVVPSVLVTTNFLQGLTFFLNYLCKKNSNTLITFWYCPGICYVLFLVSALLVLYLLNGSIAWYQDFITHLILSHSCSFELWLMSLLVWLELLHLQWLLKQTTASLGTILYIVCPPPEVCPKEMSIVFSYLFCMVLVSSTCPPGMLLVHHACFESKLTQCATERNFEF